MDSNGRHGAPDADRSIPELLQKLAADTTLLVRHELQLAQAELSQKLKRASSVVPLFGVTAIFLLGAFGALTATLIVALALLLPVWASALIVTALYAVIAAIAAQRGIASLKKAGPPVPEQTIETLRENVNAVRAGVQRGR